MLVAEIPASNEQITSKTLNPRLIENYPAYMEILRDHKVATISIGGKRAMFLPSLLARLLKVYTLIKMKMKTNTGELCRSSVKI